MGCGNCTGVLRWNGPPSNDLFAVNGLRWSVATNGIDIQIGCQNHPVSAWLGFSENDLEGMEEGASGHANELEALIKMLVDVRLAASGG